jgi:hypothetical protein
MKMPSGKVNKAKYKQPVVLIRFAAQRPCAAKKHREVT